MSGENAPRVTLAAAAHAGSREIWLTEEIGKAWAVRIGDPEQRSYVTKGIAPERQFPSSVIRLRTVLHESYAAGEPVEPVTGWAEWMGS
jgi:hypothetical protein